MSDSTSHPEIPAKNSMSIGPLPASHKIYRNGKMYDNVRVAMREIMVSSSATGNHHNGESSAPGIVVYDTSGPYTDPTVQTEVRKGLEPLRLKWILARGEAEESPTLPLQPRGNGGTPVERFPDTSRRPVLRAKPGRNVTQMHFAKKGEITPEMEYIAIRENLWLRKKHQKRTETELSEPMPATASGLPFLNG